MFTYVVGLGLNLPPHRWRVRRALAALDRLPRSRIVGRARVLANPAQGRGVRGMFLNSAVALASTLRPEALLARLQRIERALGRRGGGDRPADLDIIAWHDGRRWRRLTTRILTIPHPRAAQRTFVSIPCADLHIELPPELARATSRHRWRASPSRASL